MRQWAWIAGIFALLALIGFKFAAWGQPLAPQGSGVLGVLTRGQHVSLDESGGRFQINAFVGSGVFFGSEVVDVGNDFVVLRDLTGVTETRIPIYSIKAVITGRSKQR